MKKLHRIRFIMICCILTTIITAEIITNAKSNAVDINITDETSNKCQSAELYEPIKLQSAYIEPTSDFTPITNIDITDCYDKETIASQQLHLNVSDITEPSGATKDHIKDFIAKRSEWTGLDDYLISLDSKINIIFLIAVARAETGAGENCVGHYNCFNIRKNDGSYYDYNSYKESIDHFVNLILNEYVSKEGKWYEGTGIRDIAVHYAGPHWGEGITKLSKEIIQICSKAPASI